MAPLLSVVIPVFNGQEYISQAINSMLCQGFSENELEIIVINDGSVDDTKSIIDNYAEKYDFIKVYHQSNKGLGATRNISFNYAIGKYIYFLDSDDFLVPNALSVIILKMLKDDLDLVGFKSLNNYTTETKPITNIDIALNTAQTTTGPKFIEKHDFTNTVWWYLCNREFLMGTGFKNSEENQLEDCVFTANLLFKTTKMKFIPLPIHNYYIRESSIMHNNDPVHFKNMVLMYANTAIAYGAFIDKVKEDKTITKSILLRFKARQQWLSFFGIVRAIKSNIQRKELNIILDNIKKANAYPLDNFIGKDNNGIKLKLTSFVFSKRYFLHSIIFLYRIFK